MWPTFTMGDILEQVVDLVGGKGNSTKGLTVPQAGSQRRGRAWESLPWNTAQEQHSLFCSQGLTPRVRPPQRKCLWPRCNREKGWGSQVTSAVAEEREWCVVSLPNIWTFFNHQFPVHRQKSSRKYIHCALPDKTGKRFKIWFRPSL